MFNGQKSKKDHTPVVKKCFVVWLDFGEFSFILK
jgi:hypothetical protein